TFDHGESIIKLDPTLHDVDCFAASTWAQENQTDSDLGSTGPLLLDGGLVFAVGKQRTAYLARVNALGGIGGQAFAADVCSSFGDNAYAAPLIYVDCTDGVRALRLDANAATFSPAWHGPNATNGPPVVGSGAVWSDDITHAVLTPH